MSTPLYWRKAVDGTLAATSRLYSARFTITVLDNEVLLDVKMDNCHGELFDETFSFKTIGAAKSFVTKNFG